MTRTLAILAATVALIGVGTAWFLGRTPDADTQFAACTEGAVAGGSIGGPFELVNGQGETVTSAEVLTKPSLIYFGYTFCPDVCPLDNQRNALAIDLLQDDGYDVQPVFISIDPERDTPAVVGEYASYMHEDMIGLTGSPEQVKAASQAYRTFYSKQDSGDDPFYLVDHSTFTYLVLPDEGFVEFFRRDQEADEVAETTACFVDAVN